jgi:transposase
LAAFIETASNRRAWSLPRIGLGGSQASLARRPACSSPSSRPRALRDGVIYRKTSGGTDSESVSRFVDRMLTVAATCRQRGITVLDYLTRC